ncbi:MAG: hypothetical protein FWD06_01950 [Oscillospiraceae bacterium]|nr:hypothetical protein [Oscillospiraceae bacterium]
MNVNICNPYQHVNWDTFTPHRTELHCHTSASDGKTNFADMIEAYYAAGYDCLAISDHGTIDKSWTKPRWNFINRFLQGEPRNGFRLSGLTEERLREITEGIDRDGRGMLRVPFGTEHSCGGRKLTDVNSWFCDVRSVGWGCAGYRKAVRRVQQAGGLCVINHPTTSALNHMHPYHEIYEKDTVYVDEVQQLLAQHPALLGIDCVEAEDRKLWDILLQRLAPQRNVFNVAAGDEHDAEDLKHSCIVGYTWAMMPENTVENLRTCLQQGAFFAASTYIAFVFTKELHAAHPGLLAALREESPKSAHVFHIDNPDLYTHTCFIPRPIDAPQPTIKRITVTNSTITLEAENCDAVLWISNGKIICAGDAINLANCPNLGAYVRAELWGPGGNLYTQPFLLQ